MWRLIPLHGAYSDQRNPNLAGLLGSTLKWSKRVKGLIYRSDLLLRFQDVPSKGTSRPGAEGVAVEDENSLLNIEAFRCFAQAVEAGCYYSVPFSLPLVGDASSTSRLVRAHQQMGLGTKPVDLAIPGWLKKVCGLGDFDLEFDEPEAFGISDKMLPSKLQASAAADHFFFQLLSKNPARLKHDVNTFLPSDIAVSSHACVKLQGSPGSDAKPACVQDAQTAMVELPSNSCVSVSSSHEPEAVFEWILPGTSVSHLREAIVWDHDDCVQCVTNHRCPVPHELKELLEHAVPLCSYFR